MTLKECYALLDGDFEEAMSRLPSEQFVQKFVLKFLEDKSFELLCSSMEKGDIKEAFRAAHTIKGMCLNLSFTALGKSDSELTEALRREDIELARTLFAKVKDDYIHAADAIRTFKSELSAQ